jgi:hypothetical protein
MVMSLRCHSLGPIVLYAAMENVCLGLRRAVTVRVNGNAPGSQAEPMGYFQGVGQVHCCPPHVWEAMSVATAANQSRGMHRCAEGLQAVQALVDEWAGDCARKRNAMAGTAVYYYGRHENDGVLWHPCCAG